MEKGLDNNGAKQAGPEARLECQNEGLAAHPVMGKIQLVGNELTIGRGDSNNISLKADGVSRAHARLYAGDGGWGVEDLDSTNGILINGNRVKKGWLKPGDTLLIGTVTYKYLTLEQESPPPASTEEAVEDPFEKTVIMRPTVKQQVTAGAGQPKPQPTKPTPAPVQKRATPTPVSKPAASPAPRAGATAAPRKPAPRPRQKPAVSHGHWWIMIVGVALVIGFVFLL